MTTLNPWLWAFSFENTKTGNTKRMFWDLDFFILLLIATIFNYMFSYWIFKPTGYIYCFVIKLLCLAVSLFFLLKHTTKSSFKTIKKRIFMQCFQNQSKRIWMEQHYLLYHYGSNNLNIFYIIKYYYYFYYYFYAQKWVNDFFVFWCHDYLWNTK